MKVFYWVMSRMAIGGAVLCAVVAVMAAIEGRSDLMLRNVVNVCACLLAATVLREEP